MITKEQCLRLQGLVTFALQHAAQAEMASTFPPDEAEGIRKQSAASTKNLKTYINGLVEPEEGNGKVLLPHNTRIGGDLTPSVYITQQGGWSVGLNNKDELIVFDKCTTTRLPVRTKLEVARLVEALDRLKIHLP